MKLKILDRETHDLDDSDRDGFSSGEDIFNSYDRLGFFELGVSWSYPDKHLMFMSREAFAKIDLDLDEMERLGKALLEEVERRRYHQ